MDQTRLMSPESALRSASTPRVTPCQRFAQSMILGGSFPRDQNVRRDAAQDDGVATRQCGAGNPSTLMVMIFRLC